MRKANLERLLRGRPNGIFLNPFKTGAIGPHLFRVRLPHGTGGLGFEAQRSSVQERPVQGLVES